MLALDQAEIDFDPATLHQGDKAEPALLRQQIELGRNVVAADHVEDRIDAAAIRELLADLHKVLGTVIDCDIGAVIDACPAFLVGAGGRQYLSPEGLGELDRGDADAARAALQQQHLPRLELHSLEDIGPHGGEGLRETACIDKADAYRHRQALHRGGGGVLAVPVTDHQGAHLVADLPLGNPVAGPDHGARAFEARDVRSAGWHWVAPHALKAIGPVDPGAGDPDQYLSSLRLWHRTGRRHQHLRPAGRLDLDDGLRGGNVGEHRTA